MSLRLSIKIKATCPRHSKFNPAKDGEGGIKAGCLHCYKMLELYRTAIGFEQSSKRFADELAAIERGTPLAEVFSEETITIPVGKRRSK